MRSVCSRTIRPSIRWRCSWGLRPRRARAKRRASGPQAGYRGDQPERRLPERSGEERLVRRLSHAAAGAGRRVRAAHARARRDLPVTVKCRIGIDARDDYEFFAELRETRSRARASDALIVHARVAILGGLTPEGEPGDSAAQVRVRAPAEARLSGACPSCSTGASPTADASLVASGRRVSTA